MTMSEEKKYEILMDQPLSLEGQPTLYRIRALKNLPSHGVEAGDYGGWIENETNLSQDGQAWIKDCAMAYCGAYVSGSALLSGYANVSLDSEICGQAKISDHAKVTKTDVGGNSEISGNAVVDSSTISGGSKVTEFARVMKSNLLNSTSVRGKSSVTSSTLHDCIVEGESIIADSQIGVGSHVNHATVDQSTIADYVEVSGDSLVRTSVIKGRIKVCLNSTVCGSQIIGDNLVFSDSASVFNNDYIMVGPLPEVGSVILHNNGHTGRASGTTNGEHFETLESLAAFLAEKTGHGYRKLKRLLKTASEVGH